MIHSCAMKKFHKTNKRPNENSKIFFHISDHAICIRIYTNPITSLDFYKSYESLLYRRESRTSYEKCFYIEQYFDEFVKISKKSIFVSF